MKWSIYYVIWLLVFLGGLLTGFLMSIFTNINKNHTEIECLNRKLSAIAGLYMMMYLIDLPDNLFSEIRSIPGMDKLVGEAHMDAENAMKKVMKRMVSREYIETILQFMDFSTLSERLSETNTITRDFLGTGTGWCRARFIVADRAEDGSLRSVLWSIENIDAEKRKEEHLQYLSETDLLTGIRNRGSGELKIKELMREGKGGMFCLLDADYFKSVNDTYGHGVGDKVLIAIADCLRNAFRDFDVVMRFGGDEFAAYAVGVTTEDVGKNIMQRFFDKIQTTDIPELGNRTIMISAGAVLYQMMDVYSFDELYQKADAAVYQSKRTEGNYVTFYPRQI